MLFIYIESFWFLIQLSINQLSIHYLIWQVTCACNQWQFLPVKIHQKHETYSQLSPWDSTEQVHTRTVTIGGLEASKIFRKCLLLVLMKVLFKSTIFSIKIKFHYIRALSIPLLTPHNRWQLSVSPLRFAPWYLWYIFTEKSQLVPLQFQHPEWGSPNSPICYSITASVMASLTASVSLLVMEVITGRLSQKQICSPHFT